ncbi:Cellulose synthase [Melia azedarach]|uniref:Cellulose synthase n=1 Tax=Melia azedarach TaxID=155640 RepID=A0ACC1Z3L3_MELAZ|nr:Cellulose synthase [Melia azedarach]
MDSLDFLLFYASLGSPLFGFSPSISTGLLPNTKYFQSVSMNVDYAAHKLACYLSDDGCSPLTFYSLVEASKFAKLWVQFCKKYNVQVRAPFRYFLGEFMPSDHANSCNEEFQWQWQKMKNEYDQLSRKVDDAAQNLSHCDLTGELAIFSNADSRNHSTIVKVIWENKEDSSDHLPHLVYISREKRSQHNHHYKAGAMNVLTRVSALMTNAPFMLNVDCDMFTNNPQVVRETICLLLGSKRETVCGFVQGPQLFYDGPADQVVISNEYMVKGVAEIQGPPYEGTGCFHRRKVIYGLGPDEVTNLTSEKGKLADEHELVKEFGACQVAASYYEYGTNRGKKFISYPYPNLIHLFQPHGIVDSHGVYSEFSAFLGCAPSDGPAAMIQQKRWATGLLEILFSISNPIFSIGDLQSRRCLAYIWILIWGLRSIPELCYAILPAYCIIYNSNFLPYFCLNCVPVQVEEPGIYIPVALFVIYNLYTLSEYLRLGFRIRSWWINQSMERITTMNAWLFALASFIIKFLGLSETVFEVTQKDQSNSDNNDGTINPEEFTFDKSPVFIPGTTILLVQLAALATALLGLQPEAHRGQGSGLGEFMCSFYLVACFWPIVKGLFRKGKYGIPFSTMCKSAVLAFIFVHLGRSSSNMG